jgi:hypothetical protein
VACDQGDGRGKAKVRAEATEDVHVALVPWFDFGPVVLDGRYRVPDFGSPCHGGVYWDVKRVVRERLVARGFWNQKQRERGFPI